MHELCHQSLFNIPGLVEWQSFLTEKARLQVDLLFECKRLLSVYFSDIFSPYQFNNPYPRFSRLRMVRRTEKSFVSGKNSECITRNIHINFFPFNLMQINRYDGEKDFFFPMPS